MADADQEPHRRLNGWNEHRALVLSELNRLTSDSKERHSEIRSLVADVEQRLLASIRGLENEHREAAKELVGVRIRIAVLGSLSGVVGTIVTLVIKGLVIKP